VGRILLACPDRRGIVAAVASHLAERGANLLDADQHTDPEGGHFFMRLEFDWPAAMDLKTQDLLSRLPVGSRLTLRRAGPLRVAILVSRQDHCLRDLLYRQQNGELPCEIACVISNHPDCAALVAGYGILYHTLPVSKETKPQQEARLQELLDAAGAELVVLARYMQVLGPELVHHLRGRCINIHHGLLPAFTGGRPYHQAYERGVKLIGATSHYVTEALDQGPIIAQAVAPVSHRDSVHDLIRKGRDLERGVLASAVRAHLDDRVIIHENRTMVFD
jgi:formyltetrahydrofolate deformylase